MLVMKPAVPIRTIATRTIASLTAPTPREMMQTRLSNNRDNNPTQMRRSPTGTGTRGSNQISRVSKRANSQVNRVTNRTIRPASLSLLLEIKNRKLSKVRVVHKVADKVVLRPESKSRRIKQANPAVNRKAKLVVAPVRRVDRNPIRAPTQATNQLSPVLASRETILTIPLAKNRVRLGQIHPKGARLRKVVLREVRIATRENPRATPTQANRATAKS